MKWRNWVNALVGVWFIISPWVLGLSHEIVATWMSVIVGAIQVIVSSWAAITISVPSYRIWQNWVSFACGIWFVFHPVLADFEVSQYWAVVAPGLVSMGLNIWSLAAPKPTSIDSHHRSGPKART